MSKHFLAIDLGASSGRAVLGRLTDRLTLEEVHRFDNGPMTLRDSLRWNVDALEREIRKGVQLARERVGALAGVGVDSWGVDYVLVNAAGEPVEPPHHYRDRRTEGVMDKVCRRLGRQTIFSRTGIQFLPFNTIYQLTAQDPAAFRRASRVLMIADYFTFRLCAQAAGGNSRAFQAAEDAPGEVTLASTSQLLDPLTRNWAADLIDRLGLPAKLMPHLVEAGSVVGECDGVPVLASAAHDTAAAVVGTPGAGDDWAFLSCGTWSLLGIELHEPVLTDAALEANLSNEAGIAGTTRLLRNIMGLWLLQECRRHWAEKGKSYPWDELVAMAEAAPPLAAVVDPDDATFLSPGNMPEKIAEFCLRTGQTPPDSLGSLVRTVLEALAVKTAWVLQRLQRVSGRTVRTIHLVGGGANNRLLCQLTADATGRAVLAGPVEATAAGNVLAQAIGVGAVGSLPEARALLGGSIELAAYDPRPSGAWDAALDRMNTLVQ